MDFIKSFFENYKLDLNNLISLLIGVVITLTLISFFYIYLVLKKMNRKIKIKKNQNKEVELSVVEEVYKNAEKRIKKARYKDFTVHVFSVINDVSKLYFPKSETPYLELTVDEMLSIFKYLSYRLEEIFEIKILHLLKGMTIKQIMNINNIKTKIGKNEVIKKVKQPFYKKFFGVFLSIVNLFNPIFWFKKMFVDNIVKIIGNKIMLELLRITTEESFKVFSGKNITLEQGEGYDELLKKIEIEINKRKKEVSKDEKNNNI